MTRQIERRIRLAAAASSLVLGSLAGYDIVYTSV